MCKTWPQSSYNKPEKYNVFEYAMKPESLPVDFTLNNFSHEIYDLSNEKYMRGNSKLYPKYLDTLKLSSQFTFFKRF